MFNSDEFNSKFLAVFSLVISVGILLFIGAAMLTGMAKSDDPVAMLVVGGLLSNFGLVIGYWFGSSAGSKRNADRLAREREATPARKVRATDVASSQAQEPQDADAQRVPLLQEPLKPQLQPSSV
jgi:membrane protein DedA with SNARE-associated domain